MNLPNRHIQNLLDCLTRSRLSFALYRLPWTDECYFVLQQSGDVEQLADIRELNKGTTSHSEKDACSDNTDNCIDDLFDNLRYRCRNHRSQSLKISS